MLQVFAGFCCVVACLFARLMVGYLSFVCLLACLFVFLSPTSKKTPWLMRCLFVAGLHFPSSGA